MPGRSIENGAAIVTKQLLSARPKFKGTTMIEVDIYYPQIAIRSNFPSSQRISTYFKASAQKYYQYATHELYDDAVKNYRYAQEQHIPFHTYTAMQKYETTYNQGRLLSVYRDRYEFTGGAHGNTVRIADTFYLPSGARLSLSDFFTGSFYKAVIFESITAQIAAQLETGSADYFEDYEKNVFKYFDENNFYLTPGGFAFFYPLYTIAPYSSGITVFIIPYEKFGPGLNKRLFEN